MTAGLAPAAIGVKVEAPTRSGRGDASRCCLTTARRNAILGDVLEADTRFSSWRNDCFLGSLALVLCDFICLLDEARNIVDDNIAEGASVLWVFKWHKVQLELEALMFYIELPWSYVLCARWRLPALLAHTGRRIHDIALGHRNLCDAADTSDDAELLSHAGPDGEIPLHIADQFLATSGRDLLVGRVGGRCPFGLAAAMLSLALWAIRGGDFKLAVGGALGFVTPDTLVNVHAQQLVRSWEEHTPQFFFDILTSHWRIWDLLNALGKTWPPRSAACRQAVRGIGRGPQRRGAAPALGLVGNPSRVLFLGGGETTFQWGSFTVRGRQVARGLRTLGIDARAWNAPCREWCSYAVLPKSWTPSTFVHVKYICACAFARWQSAVHVYDPIDVFQIASIKADAVLVQTSLALSDLYNHPPLLVAGNLSIFWLPIHHSNFLGVRADPSKPVRGVGVHTVHHDLALHKLLKRSLLEEPLRGSAEFMHLDPASIFSYSQGRVSTPQQTAALSTQLSTLSIGVVKQSGCVTNWWFCSRWKTGQRLVNLLSVGVPAIVWGDAQGHLDVVGGLWPPRHHAGHAGNGVTRLHYPAELVVDDRSMAAALHALFLNASLRAKASRAGLRLAARFSLPKLAARLARILGGLERRRCPARRCRRRRGGARGA